MSQAQYQSAFPELKFLEELGFVFTTGRAGKKGRFYESFSIESDSSLGIELFPNWDPNIPEGKEMLEAQIGALYNIKSESEYKGQKLGLGQAPKSMPRAETVNLCISGSYIYDLPKIRHENLPISEAVDIIRKYVVDHKNVIEKLKQQKTN